MFSTKEKLKLQNTFSTKFCMSTRTSVRDSKEIEEELPHLSHSPTGYVPPQHAPTTPENPTRRKSVSFSELQRRFPIYNDEKRHMDPFQGAKRAFLAAHRRKGELAADVQNKTWKTQEKSRNWEYKREMEILTTNIRLRDGEFLRRQNKAHPKRGEQFVSNTTGPRIAKTLPRDIQRSQYPRNHTLYFGA